jgi:hypothetical protein
MLINIAKQLVDLMPAPLPAASRRIYRRFTNASLRSGFGKYADAYTVRAPAWPQDDKPGQALRFVQREDGNLDNIFARMSECIGRPAEGCIAIIGDHPDLIGISEFFEKQFLVKPVVFAAFNDVFSLRINPSIKTVLLFCREESFPTYLRAVIHQSRFQGDVIVIADKDMRWPLEKFERNRPVVVVAFPNSGTNRLAPMIEHVFCSISWKLFWYSPFMRNTQYILSNWKGDFPKTLAWHVANADDPVTPVLEMADKSIYWRVKALDQATCMIVHEWVSLDAMTDLDASFVVLMRDPRDVVNSNFWHTRNETDLSDEQHLLRILDGYTRYYFGEPAYKFVWPSIGEIVGGFRTAMRSQNMYVIRFEDLYHDAEGALKAITEKIGLDPSPFKELDAEFYTQAAHLGSFEYQTGGKRKRGENYTGRYGGEHSSISARKGVVGDWRSSFTPAVVKRFKELAGDALIELGYESNNDWDL